MALSALPTNIVCFSSLLFYKIYLFAYLPPFAQTLSFFSRIYYLMIFNWDMRGSLDGSHSNRKPPLHLDGWKWHDLVFLGCPATSISLQIYSFIIRIYSNMVYHQNTYIVRFGKNVILFVVHETTTYTVIHITVFKHGMWHDTSTNHKSYMWNWFIAKHLNFKTFIGLPVSGYELVKKDGDFELR